MSQVLPVLPLDDEVVLPGMVVPFDLSDSEVRAAIDAARAGGESTVLLVPRVDGRYGPVGVSAVVEQVGRLPGGEPAAVVRGVHRMRVGTGTTGPGAALWVEATVLEPVAAGPRAGELAKEYKALTTTILQKRGAWQVVDAVNQITDPAVLADSSGYAPWLTIQQKLLLLEIDDPAERLDKLVGWARDHLAEMDVAETIRKDVQEGMEKQQREFLLRQQLAAVRKELGELSGDPSDEEEDYRARIEAAGLPEKVRRRRSRRSPSWSGPPTSRPRPAGSAPGSTRCWTSRGTSTRPTPTTSRAPARCSTPTTPASTT